MRLIDADALYLELSKEATHCLELGTKAGASWATALQNAKRRINNAPTIDAVPVVHGRWIAIDGAGQPCDEWDCSACGQRRTLLCEMDVDDMKECYPHCPNCGAKMDLEVDGDG